MNRILTLVKYDYLQRVRSYNFLIILCVSLVFASILIPDADARFSTVSIGDNIGYTNSAWVAYVTAIMCSVFISMLGYYIINSSIKIDQNNKLGQLVAATDITNFQYLLVKFLGNTFILLTIVLCTFLVSIALFFIRSSGYPFEVNHFLAAYLLIPLPSVILISALAILLEVIFKKRSVLQNTLFFFLFAVMIAQSWMGIHGDPFGIKLSTEEMVTQVNELEPTSEGHGLNIGFVIQEKTKDKRFEFTAPSLVPQFMIYRIFWAVLAVLLIYLSSKIFHRFELLERSVLSNLLTPESTSVDRTELLELDLSSIPKLDRSNSIWPVFNAELLMMVRKGSKWLWVLNIIGMVLLAITPISFAHQVVLPILWFLQVHRWADLVTKEKFHQMHYFIYSSYKPVRRLLHAQIMSAFSLAILLAFPLMIRYLIMGNLMPIASILFGALFIICLSTFIGIASGGKRLFEILFFFIVYLNINKLPYTDYFGGMHSSFSYLILLGGFAIALGGASYLIRRYELRRM